MYRKSALFDPGGRYPVTGAVPGTPRWVKVVVAVVIVVMLLAVVAALSGLGGEHGPGRHASAGPVPGGPGTTASQRA
jgi:hypothetical protein